MNVLLTGASGMLGTACRVAFKRAGIKFHALTQEQAWRLARGNNDRVLDGIDFMVHAAANTNVEQCEFSPDACYRDNFLLTEGLAKVCAKASVRLVFISSTGVYGTTEDIPYREYSLARPTTHHHRAKLLGEYSVLAAACKNIVIRTGWLFGGPIQNPKNFVARRIEEALAASVAATPVISNNEQRGCPTYTNDVAERLISLVTGDYDGLFNVVNEGNASRFEYVSAILDAAGIRVPVEAAPSQAFKRRAIVSVNEMAINWRASEMGLPEMPHWRSSLDAYVGEYFSTSMKDD
jgi:dTDP-4-dehydrorhamnose reductase